MLLSILAFFFGLQAHAGVTPLFSQDGKTATLLMAGMPSDPDAVALWSALKIPAEDFQGRWAKKLERLGPAGEKALDVDCIFSKMIQNTGTCTVILRAVPGMIEVVRSEGRARLWLSGAAAAELAAAFVERDDSTVLYQSGNGRLKVTVARDRGTVTDLVLDWR